MRGFDFKSDAGKELGLVFADKYLLQRVVLEVVEPLILLFGRNDALKMKELAVGVFPNSQGFDVWVRDWADLKRFGSKQKVSAKIQGFRLHNTKI